MAGKDYFWCDVCKRVKCFYDAELDYRSGRVSERSGKEVPGNSADVAAICDSCIKTHEIIIRERKAEENNLGSVVEHDLILKIIAARARQLGWTTRQLIEEYLKIAAKTLTDTGIVNQENAYYGEEYPNFYYGLPEISDEPLKPKNEIIRRPPISKHTTIRK